MIGHLLTKTIPIYDHINNEKYRKFVPLSTGIDSQVPGIGTVSVKM